VRRDFVANRIQQPQMGIQFPLCRLVRADDSQENDSKRCIALAERITTTYFRMSQLTMDVRKLNP
jgi:hypothetical protein